MKVESGKCRRVTAAIDVIVTLCRKSVGKRVCSVLRAVSAVTRRQFLVFEPEIIGRLLGAGPLNKVLI